MPELFILAGEASGDRIGANLISGLKSRMDVTVSGVGGEAMVAQGLKTLFPIDDLAVMGYADVLRRLPLLLWRARQTVRTVLRTRPDAVVLVDAQVFSHTVARALRQRGYDKPIILYVAPSVWAWKPERAAKIASLYNEVLSVLPFEPQVMKELGGPLTSYVGHPALERFPMRRSEPEKGPVLLLPGSRSGELTRHLPLMRSVATALADHPAVDGFVVPTPASLHNKVAHAVSDWPASVSVTSEESERRAAMNAAVLAFAVSGTATLELALAGIPHAITYVAEGAQVRLYRKALIKTIGLPNIIARREIVPEILFAHTAAPERAIAVLTQLLDDTTQRWAQRAAFASVRDLMEKGAPEAPLVDPAERVAFWLGQGVSAR
ncbi:lipid-A-disaccharide synthase [Pelagibacterium xiamenense]|uniref:lipid-A-disaccharide synthase n=1 Tax=Pelagibacterium xiamenense TaxID=2901140 RepID=UPI001E555FD4|nr:lipid-A-disaccharide synthase [Pelagibacterium xiamenense]MCD7060931.1 lipid-A-disaccharide synthase [Pelagibacterium xiamenense]